MNLFLLHSAVLIYPPPLLLRLQIVPMAHVEELPPSIHPQLARSMHIPSATHQQVLNFDPEALLRKTTEAEVPLRA